MAAKPINPDIAEAVVCDWRLGGMSQREIADKHKLSLGAVNKLVKGKPQDAVDVVNAGVQYHQALHAHGERMVNAIECEVDERTRHIQFFNSAAVKNVQEAMDEPCANQMDYRARADTISKGREVVLGKTPDTSVQINNTMFSKVERTIVDPVNSDS